VTPSLKLAQRLALGILAVLLAGAYLSEYGFGLYPCEMCWWQRYAHFAAVLLALVSTVARPRALWIALAALAILVSGLIGAFHAGVEYGWWEGFTTCTTNARSAPGQSMLDAIMQAQLVRCDVAPWELFGISLAGYNALLSLGGALLIVLAVRKWSRS